MLPYEVSVTRNLATLDKLFKKDQEGFLHSQPRKIGGFQNLMLSFQLSLVLS